MNFSVPFQPAQPRETLQSDAMYLTSVDKSYRRFYEKVLADETCSTTDKSNIQQLYVILLHRQKKKKKKKKKRENKSTESFLCILHMCVLISLLFRSTILTKRRMNTDDKSFYIIQRTCHSCFRG
jgi:hypothetical protein